MTTIPKISGYGDYSSENYGLNSLKVVFENFTLFYSYATIIAYRDGDDGLVIRENDWNPTTGKHLNWINYDKSIRIDGDLFEQKLKDMLNRHTN
jgi:hypothetical protein